MQDLLFHLSPPYLITCITEPVACVSVISVLKVQWPASFPLDNSHESLPQHICHYEYSSSAEIKSSADAKSVSFHEMQLTILIYATKHKTADKGFVSVMASRPLRC